MEKVVFAPQLERYAEKAKESFVGKERKTGSETEYKVLSDNNLTDELKQKIENAGDSTFTGAYGDLTDKPSIDGTAIEGSMSAEDLGLATTEAVDDKIAAAVGSVYKPKGSCAFAELPEASEAEVGNVYDVTDVFVTDENFVEGAGLSYPARTNVVCVNPSEGVYKWDVLAGMVDMTPYVQKSELVAMTDAEIDALFE